MFNETIGGVPVALAYCTLCGAGILFETQVEGRNKPLVFGSSGFLYRSNKLMFDRQTHSLWNQFTGEPVSGPLRGSGIKLSCQLMVGETRVKRHEKSDLTMKYPTLLRRVATCAAGNLLSHQGSRQPALEIRHFSQSIYLWPGLLPDAPRHSSVHPT